MSRGMLAVPETTTTTVATPQLPTFGIAGDAFAALNFACLSAFGGSVTYEQPGGSPFAVAGIFSLVAEEEKQIGGVYAKLFVVLSDFSTPPGKGDFATIGGVQYIVYSPEVDITGASYLPLRKRG